MLNDCWFKYKKIESLKIIIVYYIQKLNSPKNYVKLEKKLVKLESFYDKLCGIQRILNIQIGSQKSF